MDSPPDKGPALPRPDRLVSREEAGRRCGEWRALGKRIVFTNGCFDLIHAGHVLYLAETRALGDLLVVGLNSDDSVRDLKGNPRPYMRVLERAWVLLSLRSVDLVCVFPESTPLELIRVVRPDILAKGGDYRPGNVVGRDVVESYGGSVAIVQYHPGYSSSSLIQRIRGVMNPPWAGRS